MKKYIICCLALLLSLAVKAEYNPTDAVMKSRTEFQDDKFGIFLHWGIYAPLGQGEWAMKNQGYNYLEYPAIAGLFNPQNFDADAWVKAFKDAGAKYITFTSRHHDGFSMWDSKVTDYNIIKMTPYAQDVVKKLADACKKYGIHLHLYYSHMDWYRNDYPIGGNGNPSGHPTDQQDYNSYFKFMNDQLTELLTNYGPIRAIWFDGYWDHPDNNNNRMDWRLPEQYALIHKLQPSCMIGNNHHVTPKEGEDFQMFERDQPGDNTAGHSAGQQVSQLPLETCQTMNGSWGYNSGDHAWKSTTELLRLLIKTAGKNANLLLNIGPRPDGTLPTEALQRLKEMGDFMKANGETIYGTRGAVMIDSTTIQSNGQNPNPNWVSTKKGNKLYIHMLTYSDNTITLPLAQSQVKSACMYQGKANVPFTAGSKANTVTMQLPVTPSGIDTILEITLNE